MIENKDVAKEISNLMLDIGARLDASVARVQSTCSEEDYQRYNNAVATIMAEMLLEVMNPLYTTHPDLKPTHLD